MPGYDLYRTDELARLRGFIEEHPNVATRVRRELVKSIGESSAHRAMFPKAYKPARKAKPSNMPLQSVEIGGRFSLLDEQTVWQGANYRASTLSNTLESWANDILRHAGTKVVALDVFDRHSRTRHVRPEAIAFRGVARYKRRKPSTEQRTVTIQDRLLAVDGVISLVTRINGPARRGWLGHVAVTFPKPTAKLSHKEETKRAQAKEERETIGTASAFGPVVTLWDMAPKSVANRYRREATNETNVLVGRFTTRLSDLPIGHATTICDGPVLTRYDLTQVTTSSGLLYALDDAARRLTIGLETMPAYETMTAATTVE